MIQTNNISHVVRYGMIVDLINQNRYSLRDLGGIFGISGERVRQIIENGSIEFKYKIPNLHRLYSGRDYVRAVVRMRDKYTCQNCKEVRTPEDSKRTGLKQFDVHHLSGLCGKRSKGYDRMSEIGNLVTLCHRCHFNHPLHSRYSRG